jgi:cell wall-associated NlpC family hydrolase
VGIDCSGLVGNLMEREGQAPARDAAQQFLSGKLVGTPWYRDAIRAGDRLYFINASGKISHTGIAMSPTHFIHSSPPGVQINSLRKGDRLYSAHWDETFLGAKRP